MRYQRNQNMASKTTLKKKPGRIHVFWYTFCLFAMISLHRPHSQFFPLRSIYFSPRHTVRAMHNVAGTSTTVNNDTKK